MHLAMGVGPEFDRIRTITAALGDVASEIGDDTATIPAGSGTLVTSVDATVEGVHFQSGWLSAEEVGWRATAAALSDLAAAGATPVGVLLAMSLPAGFGDDALTGVARGVAAMARSARARVSGGNLTAGPVLSLTITVFGHAMRPMSRRGARPGDGVYVTGVLGGAHAALVAWQGGGLPSPAARSAFARPQPRLLAGRWLAEQGATALMDLSDGLAGDAGHLAAASGVGIEVDLARLPVHPAVLAAVVRGDVPAAVFAAQGGEDYELLATIPGGRVDPAHAEPAAGVSLTRIGTVVAGGGARFLLHGREVPLAGHQHG